ncbi:hypothetical protein QWY87_11795 [Lutimonas halocynthiae]|uniref:hypothetical protein n=1 Tax=Lutimonas halocynthiae TaxID=1446477 RepID=UPI0025B5E35B|nr:hypothetical protein [Lutimonas halocynthiae]MDN3643387.1 hypothetical protein [Lutimonas halocynthiae]
MRKFIVKIVIFFIVFGLIFLFGIMLPATPAAKNNMLAYKTQKDSLLANVASPRIIFVGGSNLVFGLDSERFKDEFSLNPINAGLAVNFGLYFMMEDVLTYIRPGDYIVLAPEYQHYYGKNAFGGNDLLRLLMDTDKDGFKNLSSGHIPNLMKAVPVYFLGKFNWNQYFYNNDHNVYGKHIFNQYGDSNFHWGLKQRTFPLVNPLKGPINNSVIEAIKTFDNQIKDKGATLFVTYPGFQESSYQLIKNEIEMVQFALEKADLEILGTPKRYVMPDSLMFDQIYHLSKQGVDRRTSFLIEDLHGSDFLNSKSNK